MSGGFAGALSIWLVMAAVILWCFYKWSYWWTNKMFWSRLPMVLLMAIICLAVISVSLPASCAIMFSTD
jgi:hypothetical protein